MRIPQKTQRKTVPELELGESVFPSRSGAGQDGFTLVELLVSMTILAFILATLTGAVSMVADTWKSSEERVEAFQSARGALEMITREMTPASVDTKMQFAVMPGTRLEEAGADFIAPESPTVFWMAPLGLDSEMRCVGYYLYRNDERKIYRLMRYYVGPKSPGGFFPPMYAADLRGNNREDSRNLRTSPVDADWFFKNVGAKAFDALDPDNDDVAVSPVAENVVALWIQSLDLLGNPIPWLSRAPNHPDSDLIYNSAGFFHMATTVPFDSGRSTEFLAETPQSMKANRVPSAIEITVITLNDQVMAREPTIPQMENIFEGRNGVLDIEASVAKFNEDLLAEGIKSGRTFSTRVKLLNGS